MGLVSGCSLFPGNVEVALETSREGVTKIWQEAPAKGILPIDDLPGSL